MVNKDCCKVSIYTMKSLPHVFLEGDKIIKHVESSQDNYNPKTYCNQSGSALLKCNSIWPMFQLWNSVFVRQYLKLAQKSDSNRTTTFLFLTKHVLKSNCWNSDVDVDWTLLLFIHGFSHIIPRETCTSFFDFVISVIQLFRSPLH